MENWEEMRIIVDAPGIWSSEEVLAGDEPERAGAEGSRHVC